jgi:hypothetical protein
MRSCCPAHGVPPQAGGSCSSPTRRSTWTTPPTWTRSTGPTSASRRWAGALPPETRHGSRPPCAGRRFLSHRELDVVEGDGARPGGLPPFERAGAAELRALPSIPTTTAPVPFAGLSACCHGVSSASSPVESTSAAPSSAQGSTPGSEPARGPRHQGRPDVVSAMSVPPGEPPRRLSATNRRAGPSRLARSAHSRVDAGSPLSRSTSRRGDNPYSRRYSRLNWEGLW